MDITLLNPQARARRNALTSLQAMQLRRARSEEANRAVIAARGRQLEGAGMPDLRTRTRT